MVTRSSQHGPDGETRGSGVKRGGTRFPRARTSRLLLTAALLALAVAALAVAATGCGAGGDVGDAGTVSTTETPDTTTTTPLDTTTTLPLATTTSTTAGEETMIVTVYFSRNEKMSAAARVIPRTQQVGAAAMRSLLDGPTAEESAAGMVTSIPEGTTFLGLSIENGVATVDLSKEYASGGGTLSMMMRLAEVIFTLTQFPTVDGVNFKLDGKPIDVLGGEGLILDHPMSRADYEDMSPPILVESPTVGNTIRSPVRVTGTANTFEAVFTLNLVDARGVVIADEVVMATSGTGTRGTFDVTVPFTVGAAGPGTLIVFAESAQDGSPMHQIEIPLKLEK